MASVKNILEQYRILNIELLVLSAVKEKTLQIETQIEKIKAERQKTIDLISILPDSKLRAYLTARYINGLRYWEIADAFNVEERTCYRNVKAGIKEIERLIENRRIKKQEEAAKQDL